MLRLAGYSSGRGACARGSGAAGRFFLYTRRDVSAFLRKHFGFAMLSAGSMLGRNVEAALRPCPQTCAKESLTLWTLFM